MRDLRSMESIAAMLGYPPSKRPDSYVVSTNDCAGQFDAVRVDSFEAALTAAREFKRLYPAKVVQVSNFDRCDIDTDGLTDDEREAVSNV